MTKFGVGLAAFVACCLSVYCLAPAPIQAKETATGKGLLQHCAKVRNDDTVRGYDPSLREPTIKAFKTMFPDGKAEPDPSSFAAEAHYRCMNARVMVCFVGANLPCVKINTAKDNPGANAFCKQNPDEDSVPAFATGHDSAYTFKCRGGKAVVNGTAWTLDKRGFAREIWTALPGH